MRTRQETTEEAVATIIQTGFVARKSSWEITQEILGLLEQVDEERRYHESRMPGDHF
jgi:hypothetical protein